MPDFAIIDSHMHLMDPSRFYYRWLVEAPPLNRAFFPEDYAAARKGVDVEGAVFMEVWVGDDERIAEVDWVANFAAKNPLIKAILAAVLLEDPERTRRDIEELKRRPLVRGVRKVTEPDPPGYTLAPGFLESTRYLGKQGLTSDIAVLNTQINEAAELIRQCPDTQFVLNHLCKPDIADPAFDVARWRREIKELSKRPNVVAKISGLVNRAVQPSTVEQIKPYVDHMIECFGFDRCMFGGDWPVAELGGGLAHWVAVLDAATKSASEDERRMLFRDTAKRIYRL
jgi:predicted TIM-barrel fold metal-dependent hydrolase